MARYSDVQVDRLLQKLAEVVDELRRTKQALILVCNPVKENSEQIEVAGKTEREAQDFMAEFIRLGAKR